MKNAFYYMLNGVFIHEIFTFLSWIFGHVGKRHDKKGQINIKIYYMTNWTANNCNAHISQYFKKQGYHVAFFKNNAENQARKLVTDHFSVFLKY